MIFFDTCIWFELLGVRTPQKEYEIKQTQMATTLLADVLRRDETIVTCKEQVVELINAIEKAKMRTVSKQRKAEDKDGIGNFKQFRRSEEFLQVKELCKTVIEDLQHFAVIESIGEYHLDSILERLHLIDIRF